MALILPQIKAPNIIQTASKVSQSQNCKPNNTPVSIVRQRDGSKGIFPHFVDRPKPGIIAVSKLGRRFVNEANSYHDFVAALLRECAQSDEEAAYLICDHTALRRYGLGFVKPFPVPFEHHIRFGYAMRGRTIEDLARQIVIEPQKLKLTIAEYNDHAQRGEDPLFGKGSTAYNRFLGDSAHKPNPCVAPIESAPFYAIKVLPADIGTYAGLKTDRYARVLDAEGRPVTGLYAAGNDAVSIMGDNYPGGGITLGPGMTFGYIAARHLAEQGLSSRPLTRAGKLKSRTNAGNMGHRPYARRTIKSLTSGRMTYHHAVIVGQEDHRMNKSMDDEWAGSPLHERLREVVHKIFENEVDYVTGDADFVLYVTAASMEKL